MSESVYIGVEIIKKYSPNARVAFENDVLLFGQYREDLFPPDFQELRNAGWYEFRGWWAHRI